MKASRQTDTMKYPIWRGNTAVKTVENALMAVVATKLTQKQFLATDHAWKLFKSKNCPDTKNPPANHTWSWYSKVFEANQRSQEPLALVFEGSIEGLIIISLTTRKGRAPGNLNLPVLYIEYLEAAPWNQPAYTEGNIRYAGVGTSLLAIAKQKSFDLGCGGRLGLHSLKAAETFYLGRQFVNLGYDPEEKLDYLEKGG